MTFSATLRANHGLLGMGTTAILRVVKPVGASVASGARLPYLKIVTWKTCAAQVQIQRANIAGVQGRS